MPKGPIIGALHDDPTVTILEQLKRDEGVRHTAYQDTHGVWTVGVGHNLRVPLSDTAIEQILADDLLAVDTACRALPVWYQLSPARQGVLLNMAFNVGFDGLLRFQKMFAALRSGDYERAAVEMRDSLWARQVGARADRLAKQMETDAWT